MILSPSLNLAPAAAGEVLRSLLLTVKHTEGVTLLGGNRVQVPDGACTAEQVAALDTLGVVQLVDGAPTPLLYTAPEEPAAPVKRKRAPRKKRTTTAPAEVPDTDSPTTTPEEG